MNTDYISNIECYHDFDKIFNTLNASNTHIDKTVKEYNSIVQIPHDILHSKLHAFIKTSKYELDVNKFTIVDSIYIYKANIHDTTNGSFSTNYHTHNPLVTLYLIGNSNTEYNKLQITRDTHYLYTNAVYTPKYIEIHSPIKLNELTIYFDGYHLLYKSLMNDMFYNRT